MSQAAGRRRRWIDGAFIVVVVVFIALYLRTIDYDDLRGREVEPGYLVAASVVGLAARYWGVFVWRTILVDLGAVDMPRWSALSNVYAKAWLGRYIPGKVAWIAGKVYFAGEHGLSKSKLAVSAVLEALVQIVLYLVIALALLGGTGRLDGINGTARWTVVIGSAILALAMAPPVFNRVVRLTARVARRNFAEGSEVSGRLVVRASALHAVGFVLSGASYALLTRAFTPLDFPDAVFVVAVFNLAGAIGVLALIAPSGLGVREGVQLVFLPSVMLRAVALVVTVAARLWSTVIDVVFYFATVAHHRTATRRSS